MKTTDLIPLILYQLENGDKYGYEIVQQIEIASNGGITIKQPTLYSVLKKLEQGKFITSYWQDSEIGGKRHYYKLTDNGREQLSTYPSFEQLIADSKEDISIPTPIDIKPTNTISFDDIFGASTTPVQNNVVNTAVEPEEKGESLNKDEALGNDIKLDTPIYSPIDLTSSFNISNLGDNSSKDSDAINPEDSALNESQVEIVAEPTPIDNKVEVIGNSINIFDIVETTSSEVKPEVNDFAENDKVAKFTEAEDIKPEIKVEPIKQNKLKDKITPSNKELFETSTPAKIEKEQLIKQPEKAVKTKNYKKKINIEQSPALKQEEAPIKRYDNQVAKVKYLDYIDFKTNPDSMKRHKALKLRLIKMSLTTLTLIAMLVSTFILAREQGFSRIYCIGVVIAGVIVVFYPAIMLFNVHKIRLKYSDTLFRYHVIRDLMFKLILTLVCVIMIGLYNMKILNSFDLIIKFDNFTNLFSPIIFSAIFMLDFIFSFIIYRKYIK